MRKLYFEEYGPFRLWKALYEGGSREERDYPRRLLGA